MANKIAMMNKRVASPLFHGVNDGVINDGVRSCIDALFHCKSCGESL